MLSPALWKDYHQDIISGDGAPGEGDEGKIFKLAIKYIHTFFIFICLHIDISTLY